MTHTQPHLKNSRYRSFQPVRILVGTFADELGEVTCFDDSHVWVEIADETYVFAHNEVKAA